MLSRSLKQFRVAVARAATAVAPSSVRPIEGPVTTSPLLQNVEGLCPFGKAA